MRPITAAILGMVGLMALVYLSYIRFPKTRFVPYTLAKMVADQREISVIREIDVKGERVWVDVKIPITLSKSIHETKYRKVDPTPSEYVLSIIIGGVALIFLATW